MAGDSFSSETILDDFWATLADGVSQWPRLQSMSLGGAYHILDVLAGLHDLALQSSHVVDQIWHSRCWSQCCSNALLGAHTTVEW